MGIRYAMAVAVFAATCAFAQQQASPKPNPPQAQKTQQHKQSPAEANPFPEEKSQKAADEANAASKPSSGSSSSHMDLNRLNAPEGSEARISNGEGGYIHNPELAAKDIKIGKFYLSTHAYKGAYDRFLEATRVAPENGEAVFGLAEAARGLHKDKEAATNYLIYLDAFPDGKDSKDARKALDKLGLSAKKK